MSRSSASGPLTPPTALVFGRVAVDLVAPEAGEALDRATAFVPFLGGTAANVAVGMERLGVHTGVVSRVGDDPLGRWVRHRLETEGVDTTALDADPKQPTPLVLYTPSGPHGREVGFYRADCADRHLDATAKEARAFAKHASLWVMHGTALAGATSRATLFDLLDRGPAHLRRAFIADLRPPAWGDQASLAPATILAAAQTCDVVFGTEDELRRISEMPTPEEAAALLLKGRPSIVVATLASRGAYVATREHAFSAPAFAAASKDDMGAGDAFAATFLASWLAGRDLRTAARRANAAAAIVITRLGCASSAPRAEEIDRFLASASAAASSLL